MIKTIKYGPYEFPPWTTDNKYLDEYNKASKSWRNREPEPLWLATREKDLSGLTLHICPKCFLYTSDASALEAHKCRIAHPPGLLRYQSPKHEIYEVEAEGESTRLWVQSLALFGKMFLETKSVCYALDGFTFYVLWDRASGLVAGFFSKEQRSWFDYNLACIIVFPPFQRQSLGNLLVAFSYYLTRQQGTTGSPEKPLSTHGERTYVAYWCFELSRVLLGGYKGSLKGIAQKTGIDTKDIVYALEHMGALGKHDGCPLIDGSKVAAWAKEHPWRVVFDEKYTMGAVAPA